MMIRPEIQEQIDGTRDAIARLRAAVYRTVPAAGETSRDYRELVTLVSLLAAHTGRTDATVARWCGVHGRLFGRLRAGHGCRVDTFNAALRALSDLWPTDLTWPASIERPQKPGEDE